MGNRFFSLTFSEAVKEQQEIFKSRSGYLRAEKGPDSHHELTEDEAHFISLRDSFYMASIGHEGWSYIQHRGGPIGFLKVLSPKQLAFADFSGNRQYISVGNLTEHSKVALILMDYPHQSRLKILGQARTIAPETNLELAKQVIPKVEGIKTERIIVIEVDAYDWNCPQHITPRWTEAEIKVALAPLHEKIKHLENELALIRRQP